MAIVASNSITISNVNDGTITHTAWSYSADGTDRFTTVYPNLNLLNNSLFNNPIKTGPDSDNAIYGLQSNVVGSEYVINKDNPNKDLTISTFYVSKLGLPIGMYTSSITITNSSETVATFQFVLFEGTADTNIKPIVNGNSVPWDNTGGNPRLTINIPANSNARYTFAFSAKMTNFTGTNISQFLIFRETTAISVTRFSNPKLEQGLIATPWMPSSSEATTADYPSYIGQYSDFTSTVSTDPAKYAPWTIFKGNDGVGIKTTDITYAMSTSGTTAPSTGWTSSVPTIVKGQYLWTKTVWTYTDTSSKTGYSVTYISKDGTNGTNGTSGIIVSSVAPASPQTGQLWQDTSTTPQLVKKWTGSSWVIWAFYAQNLIADSLETVSAIIGKLSNFYTVDYGAGVHTGTVTIENGMKIVDDSGISRTITDFTSQSSGQGMFARYLPDKNNTEKYQQAWYTPFSVRFDDTINNWHGQITAENVTLVPWTNLTYQPGFTTAENNPCQYRKIKNLDGSFKIEFRGQIKPASGSFAVNSTSYVASIPSDAMPLKNAFGIGIPDFTTTQNVRLVVVSDPLSSNPSQIQLKVTGGATSYVSIDMLEYTI